MAYNPTLGRWMQQDPMEYVDGMSLYGYESSDPTSLLDFDGLQTLPSDAAGTQYKRDDGAVVPAAQLEHGGQVIVDGQTIGQVRVYTDVTAHAVKDGLAPKELSANIQLEFTRAANSKADCTKARWLQFVMRSPLDAKGAPVQGRTDHSVYGSYDLVYGKWYLDARTVDKVYYDEGGTHNRTQTESSVFDRPDLDFEDGWSANRVQFKSYLIYNDRPIYLVEWERRREAKDRQVQPSKYAGVRGIQVQRFVDGWAKEDNLPVAERQLLDGKTDYQWAKNPVPRDNR